MAFSVLFPAPRQYDPNPIFFAGPSREIFTGEASYDISAVGVLTITYEQAGKLRVRHFSPDHWIEVEDNVEPPE